MEVVQSIGAPLDAGFRELRLQEVEKWFEDEETVIHAVRTWLHEQETSWYREGMHALVSRWCKAVDVDGDYVEKSRVKEASSILCMNFIHSEYIVLENKKFRALLSEQPS